MKIELSSRLVTCRHRQVRGLGGAGKVPSRCCRTLSHAGFVLLLSTPIGRESLCIDAHRVIDPGAVVEAFGGLDLLEFHLIDDDGLCIIRNRPSGWR